MKGIISKYKSEIAVFSVITILYLLIIISFYTKTTVFYDTHEVWDVLLDTDTGILFKWNTFAVSPDNSKHILFLPIVSIIAYPIYLLSQILTKYGFDFDSTYGMGLAILQIIVSSTSITLIYNHIKKLNISKITLLLIIGIMAASFPQIFMSLSIERFIYAQMSIVVFVVLVGKLKNKESYLIDILAIPLLGITVTNIYLYFINLLLQFKLNIKKILKHIGVFTLATYVILIITKSYDSLFSVGEIVQYNTQFLTPASLFGKLKMTILRLIYPTLYFPGHEVVNRQMNQNGDVNKIFLVIIMIVFIGAIIGGIKNYKQRIPQLCLGTLLGNIILHGVIGYNLKNANIMTIHFSFAIIILLGYLATTLDTKKTKIFNIFLIVTLSTIIISNIQGFIEMLNLGISIYPK